MEGYPLIHRQSENAPFGWDDHKPISVDRFLTDVFFLAQKLPDQPCVLNLCQNRYRFLVGFAAALIKEQTNILPPNKTSKGLQAIVSQFPEAYCLTDDNSLDILGVSILQFPSEIAPLSTSLQIPQIAAAHTAVIAFTSGSTGTPQPHLKSWRSLVTIARNTGSRLIPENLKEASVIATVPPQHMYGLETSIMLPLQHNVALHGGHPFFPEDIREALESVPKNRVLITTPIHLKACVETSIKFPEISLIVSATAPLAKDLAQTAEQMFATRVYEIYGCTEAGSLATRQTTRGNSWRLFDGINLTGNDDQCYIDADYLSEPVKLPDIIKNERSGMFELQGRSSDIVNIGGKRASLGELNHHLNEIKGVVDGSYFVPPQNDTSHNRLIAFIVAKDLQEEDILQALKQYLDPVFLPRPIYFIESLPRTSSGKVTRKTLLEIFSKFKN
jgi:acyl-coenzyme A synthetase/AMP-(fatty) acid ligase